ncbi:MAG TPA: BatD family protein [Spirochaetota bacterium]|nr:BatD family protein [Spirochaetota bacterium]
MKGKISRKTGRALGVVLLVAAMAGQARAANIDVELDDRVIAAGETTALKVKISDAAEIRPVSIPSVQGLEITYAGMSRSIEIVNWKKSMSSVFTFHITGFRTGTYTVPPFVFETDGRRASTRKLSLTVSKSGPARPTRPGSSVFPDSEGPASVRSLAELSGRAAYCGEPLVMRYYILSSGGRYKVEGIEKPPEARGFVVKEQEEEQEDGVVALDGAEYSRRHLVTYILIPTVSGRQTVEGGSCIISVQESGSFFPFARQRRLVFESKDIDVRDIPVAGAPGGFSGLVGEFTITADCSTDPVPVYGEKAVTVTVSGRGNLLTMGKPEISGGAGKVRTISEEGESSIRLTSRGVEGDRKFIFTAIPEEKGEINLGSFYLVFFNPRTGKFETARTGDISLTATGDGKSATRMDFEDETRGPDFNPLLIGGIIALLAVMIVLVVLWERRRYSIVGAGGRDAGQKEEPESPALIDYRKEMFAAMQKDDSEGFLRSTERALSSLEKEQKPENAEALRKCREKIYASRFGGGALTRDDIEEIYKAVARIIG